MSDNLGKYLTLSSFQNLPVIYKRSFLVYQFEVNSDIDWALVLGKDIGNINWDIDKTVIFIANKTKDFFIKKGFAYGTVPLDILKEKVMQSPEFEDFDGDFEKYHEWYGSVTNHGSSVWPILVSDEDESYITDG